MTPGPYYEMAAKAVERLQFQEVALHKSRRIGDPPRSDCFLYKIAGVD